MAHLRALAAVGCLTLGVGDLALLDLAVLPDLLVARAASSAPGPVAPSPAAVAAVAVPPAMAAIAAPASDAADGGGEVPGRPVEAEEGSDAAPEATLIFFALDQAALDPAGAAAVDQVVLALRADPRLRASVEGHADALGSETHNELLSQDRADVVATALRERGIDAERIEAHGFGERRPLVVGRGRATGKNRRVEIHLARTATDRSRP